MRKTTSTILFVVLACSSLSCTALKEIANLRNLVFSLDRISDVRLAGVPMQEVERYDDLAFSDLARVAGAVASRNVPLALTLDIGAENPEDNQVKARMVQLEWTLLLQDRETVSGTLVEDYSIPAGSSATIPLEIELELLSFFDDSARDLANMVLSLTGAGGAPANIKVRALPTVNTPVGPIQYTSPITIVSKTVG